MDYSYRNAFVVGYECMAAWSDLLDQINVFPVPDADTGRNLKISLAALRQLDDEPAVVRLRLLKSATGNAGNIATAFIHELLEIDGPSALADAVRRGALLAHKAVTDPKPGTMLTLFEVLAEAVSVFEKSLPDWDLETVIASLEKCVTDSCRALPELREACVVDAGALGMFIFMEAFLKSLAGRTNVSRPVTERFKGGLKIAGDWRPNAVEGKYCVGAVILPKGDRQEGLRRLAGLGESLVVVETADLLKMHLHTDDCRELRTGLEEIGTVLDWSEGKITAVESDAGRDAQAIHIMTDAAGSVTSEDARALGMTLLDSYLLVGDRSYPETLYPPAGLYAAMAGGQRVSTAQASVFERRQSYLSAVSRYERVLYLCVGSAYTGNFETAVSWKDTNVLGRRFTIIDTGTASGRLGIVALATARYARRSGDAEAVVQFARRAVARSGELIFLDQLKYLAAGGRISKTNGFFGDLLHMKPIITPSARGATKVGVVRTREGQIETALKRLKDCLDPAEAPLILLQYSDNQIWVENIAGVEIRSLFPSAKILCRPLSLTAGAHMGPGTWAVAFLPGVFDE